MKIHIRFFSFFLPFILGGMLFSSCGWFETSDNGDLDGFWHLERIDTLATNGVRDLSENRLFWGVQYKLMSLQDADGSNASLYMRFMHEGTSLVLSHPYLNQWHENDEGTGGDVPTEDIELLRPYGINHLEENFVVERLNDSKMILRSETLRLYFYKF